MVDGANVADDGGPGGGETRRDFLLLTTVSMGAIATGAVAWPIIDSMNPSAEVLALASTEVDLSPMSEGQRITVTWRGNPVFIDNRTDAQIEEARGVAFESLPDPELDEDRVQDAKWLIIVGVCTHLGCVPLGQQGEFGGWFCPCHGSAYDTAGRIRVGPAPENLLVPAFEFISDTTIRIG
jgi:ubiquinol-cytochrome c reductase iron-sulfur subunit